MVWAVAVVGGVGGGGGRGVVGGVVGGDGRGVVGGVGGGGRRGVVGGVGGGGGRGVVGGVGGGDGRGVVGGVGGGGRGVVGGVGGGDGLAASASALAAAASWEAILLGSPTRLSQLPPAVVRWGLLASKAPRRADSAEPAATSCRSLGSARKRSLSQNGYGARPSLGMRSLQQFRDHVITSGPKVQVPAEPASPVPHCSPWELAGSRSCCSSRACQGKLLPDSEAPSYPLMGLKW